jgi:hypothetical protein
VQRVAHILTLLREAFIEKHDVIDRIPLGLVLSCLNVTSAIVRTAASQLLATVNASSRGEISAISDAISSACRLVIADPNATCGSALPEYVCFSMRHWPEALQGCWQGLLGGLFALLAARDPELVKQARQSLGVFAVGVRVRLVGGRLLWDASAIVDAISQCALDSGARWSVRMSCVPVVQIVSYNLGFITTTTAVASLCAMLYRLLGDEQVEVAKMASQALSAVMRCPVAGLERHVLATMLPQFFEAVTTAKAKPSDRLRGAVGLSGVLLAYPHSVPPHAPRIVEALSRLGGALSTSPSAAQVARSALQTFWQTHLRWFFLWESLFSADQIEALRSRDSPATYFA